MLRLEQLPEARSRWVWGGKKFHLLQKAAEVLAGVMSKLISVTALCGNEPRCGW